MRDSDSRSSHRDRYYSRRYRSKSRSPSRSSKSKKGKKSKKSKKYSRRSRSSSKSSSSSNYSAGSRNSRTSRKSHSQARSNRAPSSEENSRATSAATAALAVATLKGVDVMDAHVRKTLDVIEEESFEQKTFYSTRDREAPERNPVSNKVIIDLNSETVKIPKPLETSAEKSNDERIFHTNFIGEVDLKAEKWLRKLYNYRQRYMRE